ncbi:MAG TPA: molybdopterin dinucleotide binding domain-containing protein, partial [Sporichthya sp.]|nr:molybdopterin dinucleotide binding domain-containing protein [Sporichthya sp.]
HLADKVIEPPGDARSDLDIFLDYARRMDFRRRDGRPLVHWTDPASAFAAWQECSRGRPCDYTGLSYAMLQERGGVQWPCNEQHPDGTERLYVDGAFFAAPDYCETFGKDLLTGAPMEETEYRALNPEGRAMFRAADYVPAPERPSAEFPLVLTTGRTLYHFHTRTKTGRAPQLDAAAPEVWVEMAEADATRHGVAEGDLLEIRSPRGRVQARVRICGIREGVLFLPFHYGYWDRGPSPAADGDAHQRAANELTITAWDPCSKQPLFKSAAAAVRLVASGDGRASAAPTTTASLPRARSVPQTTGGDGALVDEEVLV